MRFVEVSMAHDDPRYIPPYFLLALHSGSRRSADDYGGGCTRGCQHDELEAPSRITLDELPRRQPPPSAPRPVPPVRLQRRHLQGCYWDEEILVPFEALYLRGDDGTPILKVSEGQAVRSFALEDWRGSKLPRVGSHPRRSLLMAMRRGDTEMADANWRLMVGPAQDVLLGNENSESIELRRRAGDVDGQDGIGNEGRVSKAGILRRSVDFVLSLFMK
ncbi:hypothetical protein HK101_003130 [Irineochytrium annulatum]|nr:hypothetical protein HK101_003130 [Irineochytrium annulatum]